MENKLPATNPGSSWLSNFLGKWNYPKWTLWIFCDPSSLDHITSRFITYEKQSSLVYTWHMVLHVHAESQLSCELHCSHTHCISCVPLEDLKATVTRMHIRDKTSQSASFPKWTVKCLTFNHCGWKSLNTLTSSVSLKTSCRLHECCHGQHLESITLTLHLKVFTNLENSDGWYTKQSFR